MDFSLGEEQRMLQQSVVGYLESSCELDKVRACAEAGDSRLDEVAQGLIELGIGGILIGEDQGGVGLGFLEAALVAEALGGAVAPVPFVGALVMAPVALMGAGSEAQQNEWLPKIAAGEVTIGVGVSEQIGRRETDGIRASDGKLSGKAMFVLDGMDATHLLLADAEGALHLAAADSPGVERRKLVTVDRTRSVAEVILDGVAADVLPGSTTSREPLLAAIDAGRLMLAADTLGASQTMLDKAIAYAQDRRQFNRVIGSFQAVKHMCAEMAAELEPCRSLVWYAAHAVQAFPDEARLMACQAKSHLSEVGKFVSRTATEVHGGMGFTDLLGLHYWFKRIGFNRQLLGSPELVREEAAAVQGWA